MTIFLAFIFLSERFTRLEILPIGLMIFGSLMSAFGRWDVVGTGLTLSLLSSLAAAIQQIISKVSVKDVHPMVLTFYRAMIAAATIGSWACLKGSLQFKVAIKYWVVTAAGSFLAPFAGILLMYYSYKYWEISRSSLLMTMQPLFVLVMAVIFLHKVPHAKELFGGFFILAGAFWISWLQYRKKNA
jgi:drug/metabolite transporter (DMT)-like permease